MGSRGRQMGKWTRRRRWEKLIGGHPSHPGRGGQGGTVEEVRRTTWETRSMSCH